MARAKRTARAEARRRYRADQRLDPTNARGRSDREARLPHRGDAARPGTAASRERLGDRERRSRQAFRPVDLRGDLPRPCHHRDPHEGALVVPVLLTLVSTGPVHLVAPGRPTRRRHHALSSCSLRTSSRRRPSAACSSPASWRRAPAGCSGSWSASCRRRPTRASASPGPAVERGVRRQVRSRTCIVAAFVAVPDHGRDLRLGGRLVPAVPQLSNPNRGRRAQQPASAGGRPDPQRDGNQKAGARR